MIFDINDKKPIFLGPMAGITDRAFRQICKSYGADVLVSEMISTKGIYYKDKKTKELLTFDESERPLGIQLFGSEPQIMDYAVKEITKYSPNFIDINMGCPVPKIVNNGDGSALMKKPRLAYEIISAAVKASDIPVSVKFRKGFDSDNVNAVEFAKMAEDAGATFISVHGRTRVQMYSGKSDISIIEQVKKAVKVPVVGNGDIMTPEDAKNMFERTGCDGIMVARGALGNPFIFEQIKNYLDTGIYQEISKEEKIEIALKQIKLACEYKNERIAIPEARKHISWYLKGMKNSARVKNEVFKAKTYQEIKDIINSL